MQLAIHRVVSIGVCIYILFLAFGAYFAMEASEEVVLSNYDIVLLLAEDGNQNEDSPADSKKKFNSKPLIEDDDDSAKDLLTEMIFIESSYFVVTQLCDTSYRPIHQDATTPPPWS